MDAFLDKIAALGVPGLVLVVAMGVSGYSGAAAITAGLALLGGPFGMLGGIAGIVVLALISKALARYGFEAVFRGVLDRLRAQGKTDDDIKETVDGYPLLSRSLKRKLRDYVDTWGGAAKA